MPDERLFAELITGAGEDIAGARPQGTFVTRRAFGVRLDY